MSASPQRLNIPQSQIPLGRNRLSTSGSSISSSQGISGASTAPSPMSFASSSLSPHRPAGSGPLPPRLRNALNTALLSSNSIPAIQAALLHECQASGFVAAVRARVRELLRSGQCASYGEVMARIMAEIRGEDGMLSNGNGNGTGAAAAAAAAAGAGGSPERLKVPVRVIEEGVRVVRQALEGVVEIGDD